MREGKTRRERARSSSGKVVRGGDCVLHCMSWAAGLPPVYMLVTTHLTNGAVSAPRNETCHDVVFLHPSIPLSFCPSIRPSVRPSICPPVRPSVCPSTRPSVCPTVRPSLCLSVRPSVRSSVRPSGRPPHSPLCPSVPASLLQIDQMVRALKIFFPGDPLSNPDLSRIITRRHTERLQRLLEHPATAECIVYGGQVNVDER